MGKVHDLIAGALKGRKGQVLSNQEIINLVLAKFPVSVKWSSIVVKDHAKPPYPHAPNCPCIRDEATRLFDWPGSGQYRVRQYIDRGIVRTS